MDKIATKEALSQTAVALNDKIDTLRNDVSDLIAKLEYAEKCEKPFTFTALSSGTLVLAKTSDAPARLNLQYSYDGIYWMDIDFDNGLSLNLSKDDKVCFRSDSGISGYDGNWDDGRPYIDWSGTAEIKLSGNILSVLSKENYTSITELRGYDFSNCFESCSLKITDASELLLPAKPGYHSYADMFARLTDLVYAPELPATELGEYCYYRMFHYCSSLVKAPVLPAKTLANGCYQDMFSDCISLNYVECYAENEVNDSNLWDWLYGVSASGTFKKVAGVEYPSGAGSIPSGWTVETI